MVDSVVRQQNTVVLQPGVRIGTLQVPSSKSQLHRLLICAALGERPVAISYRGLSEDIAATVRCLNALGAKITVSEDGLQSVLHVSPLDRSSSPSGVELDCGESGSTLRFLLPVAGLLGADCTFVMQGRLSKRPLAEYGEQLTAHGMTLKQEGDRLKVSGRLTAGNYVLPGNISSQFISGLLMAFGALQGQSRLQVVGTPESKPYIDMTEAVLRQSGIVFEKDGLQWTVNGGQKYALPESLQAEGDYSSATFFRVGPIVPIQPRRAPFLWIETNAPARRVSISSGRPSGTGMRSRSLTHASTEARASLTKASLFCAFSRHSRSVFSV